VASLSQGRTAAAQCGLFTHKSVPVIFEPPCIFIRFRRVCERCGTVLRHISLTQQGENGYILLIKIKVPC